MDQGRCVSHLQLGHKLQHRRVNLGQSNEEYHKLTSSSYYFEFTFYINKHMYVFTGMYLRLISN